MTWIPLLTASWLGGRVSLAMLATVVRIVLGRSSMKPLMFSAGLGLRRVL